MSATRHEQHEAHEAVLAEILSTDGDAGAAFETSALSGCASCRELVAEHVSLARELDSLGRTERADIRAALAAPASPPGRVEVALRDLALGRARSARRRSWALAAAAVALAIALVARRAGREETVRDGPKLGEETALLHPVDEVASFVPFRWNDSGPGAGWYRVVVYPITPDGAKAEPTDSGPVRALTWTPDPSDVARWGSEIHWILEVHGGAGEGDLLRSVGAWAQLSSR